MSQKWNWVERAEAWDDYQLRLAREAEIEEIKNARTLRRAILSSFWDRVMSAIENLPEQDPKWTDMSSALAIVVRELREEYGDAVVRIEGSWNNGPPELERKDAETFSRIMALIEQRREDGSTGSPGNGEDI
jgi:uncharacterized protein (DUF2267 family)